MRCSTVFCLGLLLVAGVSCDDGGEEALVRLQSIVPTIDSSEPARDNTATVSKKRTDAGADNWTSLAEALDVFSAKNLARNWKEGALQQIGKQCERDVTRYIEGLRRQELWAIKSEFCFCFFFLSYYVW